MNFMNRKLFKGRAARDKLNKMGGIMASSQPLMNTVQRFANGSGPLGIMAPNRLSTASVQIPRVDAEDINTRNFEREADKYRYDILKNRRRGFLSAQEKDELEAFKARFGMDEPEGFPAKVDRFLSDLIPVTPRPASEIQTFGTGVDAEDVNIAAEKQGDDKAVSDQIASEYLSELTLPGSDFMMPGVTPSPDKKEEPATTPEAAAARLTDGAARDKGAAGPVAQDQVFMNAAKSGELGAEKQVQVIMNEGTPQEVEKSLEQLMAEFTSAAPEREGLDKGLAIAKIGFAMAAGQSPDAISNIATALMGGADMFIKDKKEKDAFDRQVQLSALQYGIGEQSKIRAQKRADERNILKFINEDDEVVTISIAEYMKNGRKIPEGLRTENMYTSDQKAIVEKQKAFLKALEEAEKAKRLNRDDVRKDTENYSKFVDIASQAENTAFVLENVLKANAEGELSGALNAAKTGAAKVGAFLGIDVPESFSNKSVAITQLKGALQGVIKVTLAGTQSANSISNRDVDLLIQGFLADGVMNADSNGVLTFATTDENVINASLQNGLRAVRDAQAKALNQMTAIENGLAGLTTPQGEPASTILDPFRNTDVGDRARSGESRTLGYDKETDLYSAIAFGE